MSSFLTSGRNGLGQFEAIIGLINTGVSAYLAKEEARRADMEQKRQENLAFLAAQRAQADAQRQADEAATSYGAGLLSPAIASSPTSIAVIGAAGLGILWFLTRR